LCESILPRSPVPSTLPENPVDRRTPAGPATPLWIAGGAGIGGPIFLGGKPPMTTTSLRVACPTATVDKRGDWYGAKSRAACIACTA
jgi:hypothetical protein